MNLRRRLASMTALLLGAVLVVAGCTNSDGEPGEPGGGAVLKVGATLEPTGLDPSTVSGAGTPFVLLYNVYETLVKVDDNNQVRPLLANDWTVSMDGLTYTFKIDPAAKFASGADVNADAVVTSFERIMNDPAVTDQMRSDMSPATSVVAVSDDTVEVTLSHVSHQWLYSMAGPAGIIYDPEGIDDLAETPAGSGPFVFEDWDTGASISLRTNQNYWGTGPRVDGVTFMYYADPNAMNTAMLSDQLDVISNLTVPDSLNQFSDESRFRVLDGLTHGEVVLGFNHSTEKLSDLKVRQAINHGIDRQALVDTVWGGKGELLGTMVPPLDPWFDESLVDYYDYDPAKSQALLEEAGYGESGLSLRLRIPTLPYATGAARFIAAQLAEVGITVTIDELEFGTWLQQVYTDHDYDMTIVAHVEPRDLPNFADPQYYWLYDNPEFQELIVEADAAPTDEENVELLHRASEVLAHDAAADWLFLLPNLIITTTEVSGIPANAASLSFDLTSVATNR